MRQVSVSFLWESGFLDVRKTTMCDDPLRKLSIKNVGNKGKYNLTYVVYCWLLHSQIYCILRETEVSFVGSR